MGRRKSQANRIRAIHYRIGDNDEVYLLDHTGRHIDKQIEKLEKPNKINYSIKCDFNGISINKQTSNDKYKLPNIIKSPTAPILKNEKFVDKDIKIFQGFSEQCNKFPAASLMWINNPEYSDVIPENV